MSDPLAIAVKKKQVDVQPVGRYSPGTHLYALTGKALRRLLFKVNMEAAMLDYSDNESLAAFKEKFLFLVRFRLCATP